MENRRNFLQKITTGLAAAGLVSVSTQANAKEAPMKKVFVHHVFFWLKEPKNPEARRQFEKGFRN